MSLVQVNDIQMYYETAGEGTPVLLIEGLGYASWMWWKQVPALSKSFKVVAFDNRGVGSTDKPDTEYTVKIMADDAAALLRALGIERAHILGVSLGGFIAQQLALDYPELVDRLVLWSTAFGGPNMVPMSAETVQKILNPQGNTIEEKMRYNLSTAVAQETMHNRPDVVHTIITSMMSNLQPPHAYRRQMMAGALFNSEGRVNQIKAPTLIMAGSLDEVVPPANASLLADKISGSTVHVVEDTGHLFFMEKADEANRVLLDFLSR